MIIAVTEWYDHSSSRFYFDTSKVNPGNPFEAAYHALLQKAIKSKSKSWTAIGDKSIQARFGDYQNGMPGWSKLMAKVPCRIEAEVSLVMAGH